MSTITNTGIPPQDSIFLTVVYVASLFQILFTLNLLASKTLSDFLGVWWACWAFYMKGSRLNKSIKTRAESERSFSNKACCVGKVPVVFQSYFEWTVLLPSTCVPADSLKSSDSLGPLTFGSGTDTPSCSPSHMLSPIWYLQVLGFLLHTPVSFP